MATASEIATAAARTDVRNRWWLATPALLIVLLAAIGPLVVVVLYSFMVKGDYGDVKYWQFSLDGWFSVIFERDVFDDTLKLADAHLIILWRSVKLSLITTLVTLLLGFPTAYFIATRDRRWRDFWLFLVTLPFWTNLLIRTFAIQEVFRNEGVVNSALLQLGVIKRPLQIMFTDVGIFLGMAYVYLPLMVLPLYASIERFDFRFAEAAADLYASNFNVLRRIIIPMMRPGIIAGSILVFIPSLGAYVTPRLLGGGRNLMLGNLIELQFGQGRNWPLGSALSITLTGGVMLALLVYVRAASKSGSGQHG
ncbi:spermidine/putrescine transport system permease protein [Mesorhizobium soli]|uniref:ABC transporter permease n=1 Tax=Pseudaminobacter soli (ex Li et al. 2025) TaxID=1295366 RepID=UPI00247398E5|nr:ABC transporter permease [Mesorhizobium soli]MDH6233921.1 spermidine/putrescine transport system permease protein [Mesorhizobium soli]